MKKLLYYGKQTDIKNFKNPNVKLISTQLTLWLSKETVRTDDQAQQVIRKLINEAMTLKADGVASIFSKKMSKAIVKQNARVQDAIDFYTIDPETHQLKKIASLPRI